MFRSIMNSLLPNDEYKRFRMLFFMAEALILTVILFLLLGIIVYFFEHLTIPAEVPLFLIMMYLFFLG